MELAIVLAGAAIGAGLCIGGAAAGAGMGNGTLTSKALEGIARQPEAKGFIMTNMFIFLGLVEAVPIIAFVFALILLYANPLLKLLGQ